MARNEYENRVKGQTRAELQSQLSELTPGSPAHETVRTGLDELARVEALRIAKRQFWLTAIATAAAVVATAAAVTQAVT